MRTPILVNPEKKATQTSDYAPPNPSPKPPLARRGYWRLGRRGLAIEGIIGDEWRDGANWRRGVLAWLSKVIFFFLFFKEEEEEVSYSTVPYCVGPGDVSEFLYLLVGKVDSHN